MIVSLNVSKTDTAQLVLDISSRAYRVEAELIDYPLLPVLNETLDSLIRSPSSFYGYQVDDSIAGIIELVAEKKFLCIDRLAVDPAYFHQGIATRLVEHAKSLRPHLEVGTAEKNYPAINLYKKMGFKFHSKKRVGSPSITWVRYRC